MMKPVFVDSNLFLQCCPLKDIPWSDLLGAEPLRLLVPRAVQTELDKLKSDGNSRRATRARSATSMLREVLRAPDRKLVISAAPRLATLELAPRQRAPDDLGPDLDRQRPDDSIILEVLHFNRQNPEGPAALLTDDTNLLASGQQYQIELYEVQDSWRLPPEPDPRDKAINQMQERLRSFERVNPVVAFELLAPRGQAAGPLQIEGTRYTDLSPPEVEALLSRARERYPMATSFEPTAVQRLRSAMLTVGNSWIQPSQDEIRKYQEVDYPGWIAKLQAALVDVHAVLTFRTLQWTVRVRITNDGGEPARGVKVKASLSQGFKFVGEPEEMAKRLASVPKPPQAPEGRIYSLFDPLKTRDYMSHTLLPNLAGTGSRRDKNTVYEGDHQPRMREYECEEFRHQWDPLEIEVAFTIDGGAQHGGQLQFSLTAENLPAPLQFTVPFVMKLGDGDTHEEALDWMETGLPHGTDA